MSAPRETSVIEQGWEERSASSGATDDRIDSLVRWKRRRHLWIVAAALWLVASTWWAHTQAGHADALSRPRTLSRDWWLSPIESGASRRLPRVTGELNDVCAIEGTDVVWVVGDDRLALRSRDDGATWERVELPVPPDLPGGLAKIDAPMSSNPAQQTAPDFGSSYEQEMAKGDWPFEPPLEALLRGPSWDLDDFGLVAFHDERVGWIASSSGLAWRTTDGGASWVATHPYVPEDDPRERLPLKLQVFSETEAVLLSRGGILSVTEDGEEWLEYDTGIGHAHFLDFETCHIAMWDGIRFEEEGGRISYGYGDGPFDPWHLVAFESVDQHHLFAAGRASPGSPRLCYQSVDGGLSWDLVETLAEPLRTPRIEWLQRRLAEPHLPSLAYAEGRDCAWHLDERGLWRARRDAQAELGIRSSDEALYGVEMTDELHGWAGSRSGTDGAYTVVVTEDGGRHWRRVTSGVVSSSAISKDEAWIVRHDGTIWQTSDRGGTWVERTSRLGEALRALDVTGDADPASSADDAPDGIDLDEGSSTPRIWWVTFRDGRDGVAVDDRIRVYTTEDGGESWGVAVWDPSARTDEDTPADPFVRNVAFGVVLHVRPESWERFVPTGVETEEVKGLSVAPGGAVVVSSGGALWTKTSERASDWSLAHTYPTTSRVWDELDSVTDIRFVSPGRGYAVVRGGLLLVTEDDGRSWSPLLDQPDFRFVGLSTLGDDLVWVSRVARNAANASSNGLLRSRDGGRTWEDLTTYSFAPAPWYYLGWLVAVGLLVPAVRKPKPIDLGRRSVADMAASDRPLEHGDPDPLEFQAVADGLSRFLRNAATTAPLTIAVTGEWGSGKSSLMNLLEGDLETRGFRPVWFNAWHHQKEEHLLASLLQSVRSQSVPPWWTQAGIGFRARLLRGRASKVWGWAVFAVSVIGLAAGYFAVDTREKFETVIATVSDGAEPAIDSFVPHGSALALLVGLVSVGGWMLRGLRAFGGSPAKLMTSMSSARIRDLRDRISFRQRFQEEFEEVTRALGPRKLVILVDDLDRCRPRSVLEVLEAVNFLASSGECYIVLGMDLERVERCVAVGFEGVAEELVDLAESRRLAQELDADEAARLLTDDLARAREQRRIFASEYMEKLVNIEVPVPKPTVAQSRSLVADEESDTEAEASLGSRVLDTARALAPHLRAAALVLVVAGAGAMSFAIGADRLDWLGLGAAVDANALDAPAPDAPAVGRAASGGDGTGGAATDAAGSVRGSDDPAETERLASPAGREAEATDATEDVVVRLMPGEPLERGGLSWWLLVLLVAGAAAWWAQRQKPEIVVHDSADFRSALRLWHPLVARRKHTPRTLKRFLNRVRFYAMRQRDAPEHIPEDSAPEPTQTERAAARPPKIPEDLLVALSAIQHARPDWLRDPALFEDFHGFLEARGLRGVLGGDDVKRRKAFDALERHRSIEAFEPAFSELSAGVRVSGARADGGDEIMAGVPGGRGHGADSA